MTSPSRQIEIAYLKKRDERIEQGGIINYQAIMWETFLEWLDENHNPNCKCTNTPSQTSEHSTQEVTSPTED